MSAKRSLPRRGARRPQRAYPFAGVILVVLGLALVAVPSALAAIIVPQRSEAVFIQTTGPLAELGIGDYQTNDPQSVSSVPGRDPAGAGGNAPHEMELAIPCVPNLEYTVELFDPAIDPGEAIDEPRDGQNNDTSNVDWFDNTVFRLYSPGGALLQETIYEPSTAHDTWALFATISVGGSPQLGQTCGGYRLETVTGALDPYEVGHYNDDNAWQLRLNGVGFEAELGPDGQRGTGDQAQVGIFDVAYQQRATQCQDFYWFADADDENMYMLNFDMDDPGGYGLGTVCYFPPGVGGDCSGGYPGAPVIQGTRSGNTTWNDAPVFAEQSFVRPAFSQMEQFNPAAGDFAGDAVASPQAGLWRAQLCVDGGNQYSFQVDAKRVFVDPPRLPELIIDKDDGLTVVNSPGQTTYTLRVRNVGLAAALPLPGGEPEIVDQLPAGMTFASCQVNAPLAGTCAESPAGSGRVEVQISGHADYAHPVFLPGSEPGNRNEGTISLMANVSAGLAGDTQLENVATVDYTDTFGNNFDPASDNDVDTVVVEPVADLSLAKSVNTATASLGDTVVYTIEVTNSGPADASGVVVTDYTLAVGDVLDDLSLPAGSPTQGSYDMATGAWAVGSLAVGQTETLSLQGTLAVDPPVTNIAEITASDQPDPDSTPGNRAPGEDDYGTTTVNPPGTPATPAAPPSAPGAAVAGAALQKFVSPENAVVGETVTWTVVASNPTGAAVSGVTVTDTLPAMFGLVRVTPSRGTATLNGSRFSVSLGDLQPGEEVVISVETVANSLAAPPQTCNTAYIGSTASNEVCVTIFPAELPATGGAPPGALPPGGALALSIGGALLLVAGVALLWRGRRQPQA